MVAGGYDGSGEVTSVSEPPPASRSRVSLSPFSSSRSRGLASRFREPASPPQRARSRMAWVSLQVRLVGANEASSAGAIAPGLGPEEAAAWELFSPLHRVLVVAAVATATSRSRAARRIAQLQRSIDLRDEVLLSMQQKLDDLCDEMISLQEQYAKCDGLICSEKEKFGSIVDTKLEEEEGAKCCACADLEIGTAPLTHKTKDFSGMDDTKSEIVDKSTISLAEQEERRMSDLSDFSWSVASSVDNQLSSLAVEQEFYNLQKECEEKDATVKELAAAAHASSIADAKRIAELQEMVRRKNMVISKLKKDMAALKQMVVELTRLKRASHITSNPISTELPVMSNNVLYDMSSTSPSSSDSESPVALRECFDEQGSESKESCQLSVTKTPLSSIKSSTPKQRSTSPLRENRMNRRAETNLTVRQKQLISSNGDFKRIRRRSQHEPMSTTQRRWF